MRRSEERARWAAPIVSALLRDPAFVIALLVLIASVAVFGPGRGDLQTQLLICWSMLALTHIALAVIAGGLARAAQNRVGRWVWGSITVAGSAYAVGDAIQLWMLSQGPLTVLLGFGGPAQNSLVLVGTAVPLVAVLLLTPTAGHRPRRPRARLALDVTIVMIAATVFGAYLTLPQSGEVPISVWLGLLIGPGLFLAVVLSIGVITRAQHPPMTRATAMILVVATVVEAGAQAGAPVLVRADRVAWHLGVTAVASALLLAAASVQRALPAPGRSRRALSARSPAGLLPYVAFLATFALLLRVLLAQTMGVQHWAVVVGAMISAVLVVWRQIVVIADNGRLVVELDARVEDLNQLLVERQRLTEALRHEATHDPLTGLANRALLGTRLDEALARLGERPGRITLIMLDLDDFKLVNDRLGHAAGDAVLRAVGRRVRGCVRDHDLVARLGGDEFAVLLEDLPGDDDLGARIAAALRAPIPLANATVDAAASVGSVTTEYAAQSAEDLMHAADLAMYKAKRVRQAAGAQTGADGSPASPALGAPVASPADTSVFDLPGVVSE